MPSAASFWPRPRAALVSQRFAADMQIQDLMQMTRFHLPPPEQLLKAEQPEGSPTSPWRPPDGLEVGSRPDLGYDPAPPPPEVQPGTWSV